MWFLKNVGVQSRNKCSLGNVRSSGKGTGVPMGDRPGHSGSSLDIIFFYILYVSFNLSDDVFKGKKIIFP
jgi:hypothetical protein